MSSTPLVTERDMLDLLQTRYTRVRPATIADRWTRAEHVGLQLGGPRKRVADFIAADRYPNTAIPGGGASLHGHEIKISRQDWLTELSDLSKANAFKQYMHHWWLVVPNQSIVAPHELPDGWGLMVISGDALRVKISAPRLSPDPLPLELSISLMAAAARTAYRDPLHRDAPITHLKSVHEVRCGFCGAFGPCPLHQPRFHAERADRSDTIDARH
ncbi:hypothetical protein [Mycobacteroides abscessus]|uniref:hypothetical protein n=1 Tax=Mycobacteroides abscessus TaxID=36809 RepID=UPI0009D078BC|nr:hypothetical protein [Mycobacteroides abscessus]SKO15487.1 Uncharacterised protein [Mycobacteroides abscessus subsp. bolletii]SKX37304.1 Uncharacterised protein [Mycobacteroides abscessus subsp. bolletii]